jgi:ectoine hydroxylase
VERQLPGGAGDGAWGHYPQTTPLYGWLRERDLFDHSNPPLRG